MFFYLIAFLILFFGILTVITGRLFRSAIYLLFTLIGIAALYFYLQFEFIGAVQVIVYVGGIVVLILFSLFLTQQAGIHLAPASERRKIFSALAATFGFAFTYSLMVTYAFPRPGEARVNGYEMKEIGRALLSTTDHGYILPFEAVSVLLLAAMVACIVIAFKTNSPDAHE